MNEKENWCALRAVGLMLNGMKKEEAQEQAEQEWIKRNERKGT